ncbi:MAG: LamG-like jellyroll fold domain-containing protein [Thermoguttaceae bacterium]
MIVWHMASTDEIGGLRPVVKGAPRVAAGPAGLCIEFDGRRDALVLDINPIQGAAAFSIEVLLRPDAGGPAEQRFLHVQEEASEDRVLLETRLTAGGRWYADTFIKSGPAEQPLNDPRLAHPLGRWHNLALVYDGHEMIQYVDGVCELRAPIRRAPMGPGKVSLGARINDVFWFRGALATVRFAPRALEPGELLKPPM